jgi:hypothetical protein
MAPVLWNVNPNFDVDADPDPDPDWHQIDGDPQASMFHFFFVYFFGGLECVGHSFADVAHL